MEHDIGCKIKAARIEKKLTQEQVAELLGVSRQTISNWENEKSYPDIISVIKMSECYDVSLDYLLKGEQKMKSYYDYLEESTNVVKSNANRNKIITILSYLLIWAFAMIVFWFFTSGSDAMGYSLMFLWFILPISRPEGLQRPPHRFVRQNSVQAGADDGIRILSQSRVHERNLLFKFVPSSCGTAFSCLALS